MRPLQVLSQHGIVTRGTILEIVPEALPADHRSRDPRAYRARVDDPASARRSLIWELDGQAYSVTELTCKLWGEPAGVKSIGPSYYSLWRVMGRTHSLWDELKRIDRAKDS